MNALRRALTKTTSVNLKYALGSSVARVNKSVAYRGLSTLIEQREHAEEALYIKHLEEDRKVRAREQLEHILALEDDHEHKVDLHDLLDKATTTQEEKGFMTKYGLNDWKFAVPIGIILAIPALHNEVLVLDAETQLVGCFMFFVASLYTQVGGMVGKSLDDYSKQVYDELKVVDDAVLQQIEAAKAADESALTLEEDFKAYYALRDQLAVAQADLLNYQAEHKFHDAVVKKLESLHALEEAASAAIKNRMLVSVKSDVVKTFQSDKAAKDAALANAMSVLAGGASSKMGKDVVGEVFKSAVKNYATAYAKQPEGSDPILKQLEADMKAVAEAPMVDGKGGNVYVTHPLA